MSSIITRNKSEINLGKLIWENIILCLRSDILLLSDVFFRTSVRHACNTVGWIQPIILDLQVLVGVQC